MMRIASPKPEAYFNAAAPAIVSSALRLSPRSETTLSLGELPVGTTRKKSSKSQARSSGMSSNGFDFEFGQFRAETPSGSGRHSDERSAGSQNTKLDGPAGSSEQQPNLSDIRTAAQHKQATKTDKDRRSCMHRIVTVILSHLGIFFLIVAYLTMGGFLFNYLEVVNEISACKTKSDKYESKRNEAVDRVYNIAQGANASLSKNAILTELQTFAEDVYTIGVDPTVNCTTIGEPENMPNWALPNSIYFCATIITTIGYGHISPVTKWGQIVCMIYAVLGIPLMLLFLTKIGGPTAMLFRSFYLNIFCCKCFITKSTFARSLAEAELQRRKEADMMRSVVEGGDKQPPPKMSSVVVVEDEDEDDDFYDDGVVNIPITITLMLLIFYILIGAAVFRIWETEWTIIEGTYFSFITLSTIGFGDYVPGKNGPFDNISVVIELLIGAVYCVFGLAMLSMCMNLIQDELTAKLMWLSLKLGISRPEDFYNDSDSDSDSDTDSDNDSEISGRRGRGGRAHSNRTRRSAVSLTPGGRKIIADD